MHKQVKTKPYSIYDGIKTRCYNPKAHNYKLYGAKGVTMCDEWLNDFQAFASWYVSECHKLGLNPENHNYQVDKDILCLGLNISPKIYSPKTCKLVPQDINYAAASKRRTTPYKLINPLGELIEVSNLSQFCKDNQLNYTVMRNVVTKRTKEHRGYSLREIDE